jgi:hypothetical protein
MLKTLFDEIGRPFGNHHCGDIRVSANHVWHYRRIDNPQVFNATNLEVLVHHGFSISCGTHLAGASDVE